MKKLLSIFVILILGIMAFGACVNKPSVPVLNEDLELWQSNIKDEVKVIDMVMPGSHDSGTAGMVNMAETQMHSIKDQLQSGVRYFDIRVAKSGDELKIFHSIIKGMLFEEVVSDIEEFLALDNGQFLVLDFQHFENDSMQDVLEIIQNRWNPNEYAVPNNTDLSKLTMGDVRTKGYKYIITWGSETGTDRDFVFSRPIALSSPYYENEHKQDAQNIIEVAFPQYYATSPNDRFFVLQAVKTAKSVTENIYKNDIKFSKEFDIYLETLAQDKNLLAKTNIIMRDFCVTYQKQMLKIVELNALKGNFKSN